MGGSHCSLPPENGLSSETLPRLRRPVDGVGVSRPLLCDPQQPMTGRAVFGSTVDRGAGTPWRCTYGSRFGPGAQAGLSQCNPVNNRGGLFCPRDPFSRETNPQADPSVRYEPF